MTNEHVRFGTWKWGCNLLLLLMVAIASSCSSDTPIQGTDEEHEYDELQLEGNWEKIIEKSRGTQVTSLACQKVVRLAELRLGRAGKDAVYECLANSHEVLTSPTAALMMSDVYLQIGMVNMAQRAAFESLSKAPDVKINGRAYRRLTETAIITGQYEVALKYISLLEEIRTHRKWAHEMRRIAEHPERIVEQPAYLQLRNTYEKTEDQFFM